MHKILSWPNPFDLLPTPRGADGQCPEATATTDNHYNERWQAVLAGHNSSHGLPPPTRHETLCSIAPRRAVVVAEDSDDGVRNIGDNMASTGLHSPESRKSGVPVSFGENVAGSGGAHTISKPRAANPARRSRKKLPPWPWPRAPRSSATVGLLRPFPGAIESDGRSIVFGLAASEVS